MKHASYFRAATPAEIEAKTRSELASINLAGFTSLYKTTKELVEKGYILNHDGLKGKLVAGIEALNAHPKDKKVPADLHDLCINLDKATEAALDAVFTESR